MDYSFSESLRFRVAYFVSEHRTPCPPQSGVVLKQGLIHQTLRRAAAFRTTSAVGEDGDSLEAGEAASGVSLEQAAESPIDVVS